MSVFEDVSYTEKTIYASSLGKDNLSYFDVTIHSSGAKTGQEGSVNFVMGAGQMKNFVGEMQAVLEILKAIK